MTEAEIPGIFNYCNRWCGRCRFHRRCALARAEAVSRPALQERHRHVRMPPSREHLGEPLVMQAFAWMNECNAWLVVHDRPHRPASCAMLEAFVHVSWYHTLVPPKLARALDSRAEGSDDDATGSAKVAWVGLTEVLATLSAAWDELGSDPATLQLWLGTTKLAEAVDAAFPGHRDFKRPGFDE